RRFSAGQADAHEHADGLEAVPPRDLLPLRVGAAVVRDRQLVHAQLAFADLGGDLRLDAEVVLVEIEGAQHVAAERLVARLHVGQRRVVEDVREQRQEAVAKQVPEQVRPLRSVEPSSTTTICLSSSSAQTASSTATIVAASL